MASTGPFLRVRGLRKSFGARLALEGLDLDVGRGELYGLLGPNGAGKSTAFRALAGLVRADAGIATLDGRSHAPGARALRRRMGVVFQHPSVDAALTAAENLRLGAALYGVPRREARQRALHLLTLMDLAGRQDERVAHYSGGMRRRLEIARVLLHEPDLLLMDEPGQGIDPEGLRRIWNEIATLARERGVTVVVTTHQPDEAERCQRLAILDGGRMVATGTPDELRARVAGDVLQVRGHEPQEIVARVREQLGLEGRVVDGSALIESGAPPERGSAAAQTRPGHELVPRVAELFPAARLDSIAVRRPTLADVFAKLTGRRLHEGEVASGAGGLCPPAPIAGGFGNPSRVPIRDERT